MTKEKALSITEVQLDEIWLGIYFEFNEVLDYYGFLKERPDLQAYFADIVEDIILATLIEKEEK